jgi:hypothetical protein
MPRGNQPATACLIRLFALILLGLPMPQPCVPGKALLKRVIADSPVRQPAQKIAPLRAPVAAPNILTLMLIGCLVPVEFAMGQTIFTPILAIPAIAPVP